MSLVAVKAVLLCEFPRLTLLCVYLTDSGFIHISSERRNAKLKKQTSKCA